MIQHAGNPCGIPTRLERCAVRERPPSHVGGEALLTRLVRRAQPGVA